MEFYVWYALIGALLIFAVVTRSFAQRVSMNTTMLYLAVGYALGPAGWSVLAVDPVEHSWFIERMTEIVVIISLFSAGLTLSLPLRDARWKIPLSLAFVSMMLTVAAIAAVGVLALDLPLGVSILLGAILAPTDPVLASEVQLTNARDRDRLRWGLTGEAGLNDGTAFPFVMLGLGLLGLHEVGGFGWRWLAVDLVWAIAGGLAIGWGAGYAVGRLVLYLRSYHRAAVGFDEFIALGLIALSYGVALLLSTYGFLAVFAAGLALRRVERRLNKDDESVEADADDVRAEGRPGGDDAATHPATAPAYMAREVLNFNQQTEHIGELIVVVFVGAMLSAAYLTTFTLWFVPLLFVVIRPLCAWLGLLGSPTTKPQRALIAWFGIRGLGSIYYLSYAIQHGLPAEYAEQLSSVVLTVVAASIIVHGFSVAPLMRFYSATPR
ncbi:MAG: cation:proton antiporter [Burkholderiales bacterium]|nr:cation:proton antiporter [Burkholderiales bacterium]